MTPTPPPGFRLLSEDEKKRPLPMDALRHSLGFDGWVPAGGRGEVLSPGFQADPYATALPPAEPTGWRPEGAIKGTPGVEGLGERLKCVREMRRLTQADLAVKLEVPPAEVSHFETGQRLPGAKNLRKLCIALNVSADYLLDTQ